jgi:hypothetical protein
MKIRIFQIGGTMNDTFIGIATDPTTLGSLIRLAGLQGASGVSLHGTMPHVRESVSGEFTLDEATNQCRQASEAIFASIMDGIDPAMAGMDMD